MPQHKALVVTDFWATVIGGILSVAIVGGVSFAVGVASRTDVLAAQMDELKQANLPTDMATVKASVEGIKGQMGQQQKQLDDINGKLDWIIRHQPIIRDEARNH
jgi:hypothetical protein